LPPCCKHNCISHPVNAKSVNYSTVRTVTVCKPKPLSTSQVALS